MITAKIKEIQPESTHAGQTFTQTVRVETSDGIELQLFDGVATSATQELVGKWVDCEILAHPQSICSVSDSDTSLKIMDMGDSYEIIGRPCQEEQNNDSIIHIQSAYGTIKIDLTDLNKNTIRKTDLDADKIKINAYRLDLVSTEDNN
jgi:hypothetical protein